MICPSYGPLFRGTNVLFTPGAGLKSPCHHPPQRGIAAKKTAGPAGRPAASDIVSFHYVLLLLWVSLADGIKDQKTGLGNGSGNGQAMSGIIFLFILFHLLSMSIVPDSLPGRVSKFM